MGITLTDTSTTGSATGKTEALAADFASDKLTGADSADLDFAGGDFSIAWFEYNDAFDTPASSSCAIARDGADVSRYLFGMISGADKVCYMSSDGVGFDIALAKSMGASATATWIHYVARRSGNNFDILKDATQTSSWTSTASFVAAGAALQVGAGQATLVKYLNGRMQDLAIWKGYALSSSETVSLSSTAIRPSGVSVQPTHWWKMDEASGNRADSAVAVVSGSDFSNLLLLGVG